MDWKNIQADVTKILPCDYTAGREGANITGITIHHMAGNTHTISIEHANNNSNPWTVFPAALESGAHLVAALCLYYILGRPQWLVNVFPHRYWSATACPG